MTQEMINIINGKEQHKVVIARAGCFPSHVEYWNGTRWKKFKDYIEGDKVMEYDPLNNIFNISYPIKYIKQSNSGLWYNFKLENNDTIKVSDNHNMLCYDINGTYYHCRADEIPKIMKNKTIYIKIYDSWVERYIKIVGYSSIFAHNENEYCFTTNYGNLLVRDNNVIYLVGNCGKTTTLMEYIKAHKEKQMLFLVYNKELQMEFSGKLRDLKVYNCKVSTIHSIAYREWLKCGMPKKKLQNISLIEMKNYLKQKLEYADLSKIKFYFDRFLSSSRKTPFDLDEIEDGDKRYFKYVDKLWKYYVGEADSMAHNVYLKWYQLQDKKFDCEMLLCDEVNDFNELMSDLVIKNMDKEIICVGDDLQNIASFNHTIDTLNLLIDEYKFERYDLTMSFRVSPDIAGFASKFLSYMYGEDIEFKGCKDTVFGRLDLLKSTRENPVHLLSRNKLGALKEILDVLDKDPDKRIYFVGGLDNFGIKEIERLLAYKGNVYIGGEKFHISELRKMISDGLVDVEISRIVSVYDFANSNDDCIATLRMSETLKKEYADIIVQTAHSSKGGTYGRVKLGSDFQKIEKLRDDMKTYKDNKFLYSLLKSEVNLMYVAITRATDIVDIGSNFKRDELVKDRISGMSEIEKVIKNLESKIKKI